MCAFLYAPCFGVFCPVAPPAFGSPDNLTKPRSPVSASFFFLDFWKAEIFLKLLFF